MPLLARAELESRSRAVSFLKNECSLAPLHSEIYISHSHTRRAAMPKPPKDLAYSSQHVRERALERYGVTLTSADYIDLNEIITKSGEYTTTEAELLSGEGDERIWGVRWPLGSHGNAGTTLICVWSTLRCRIATLLPKETVVRKKKGSGG